MAGGWNAKVPSPAFLGTSGWRRGDSEQCASREILEWGYCCAGWRDPAAELGVLNAGLGVYQGSLGIRDLDPVAVERYLMHTSGKVCRGTSPLCVLCRKEINVGTEACWGVQVFKSQAAFETFLRLLSRVLDA